MQTYSLEKLGAQTKLLNGIAMKKRNFNRAYLMKLTPENLLLPHYYEAGLTDRMNYKPEGIHWGWDSPLSEIRGTLCGHWLSAAAHMVAETQDTELLGRAQFIVKEIARCQEANGGLWAFPIPEKYLYWLKDGKHPWAPQYVCHKNMMGLLDMYLLTGNELALEINKKSAQWFYEFTNDITRDNMSDMMDLEETGGIMEYWADLYAITKDEKHLTLMSRYERPRLADPLLEGVDMLTNMHANATIPEMMGYARAYEVTGEERYRKVVENYWDLAVTKRGMFATGGQTCGEVWTPQGKLAARLGDKNQEHCVVYHMMRLAEYLLRWTGEAKYADYWERNLYNGIFAQGYWKDETDQMIGGKRYDPVTTVAYYLPMVPGAQKFWGSEFEDFWCCHCTLLQANAIHHEDIYYKSPAGITLAQYLPSEVKTTFNGTTVIITQTNNEQTGGDMLRDEQINRDVPVRPHSSSYILNFDCQNPVEFTLSLRMPDWLASSVVVYVDGEETAYTKGDNGFAHLTMLWHKQKVVVMMPKKLTCFSLPDEPDMVAFMDGPICLAGLVEQEHLLYGDIQNPEYSLLCPDDDRQWQTWKKRWKTYRQPFGIRFRPIYEVGHEKYTIYFPVEQKK